MGDSKINMNESQMKNQWKAGPYIKQDMIGSGSFGTVYKGVHESRKDEVVAIKEIRHVKTNAALETIQREIRILKQLKHPNLVKFINVYKDGDQINLIFEYCSHGDLGNFVKKFPNSRVPEPQAQKLFQQIISGVRYMFNHNIVHRDLKLANLLVAEDYTIKIADFGWSRYADNSVSIMQTMCGTPSYTAPEVMEDKYGPKCDIWSLGVMLYQLLTGELPFPSKSLVELLKQVKESHNLRFPEGVVSPQLETLIRSMLVADPEKRIDFPALFTHYWVSGVGLDPWFRFKSTDQTLHFKSKPDWYGFKGTLHSISYYKKMETECKIPDYVVKEMIGQGPGHTVYLGKKKLVNQTVAIVKYHRYELIEDERIEGEAEIVREVHHSNIIKFHDLFKSEDAYYLIYEHCKYKDLKTFIAENNFANKRMPEHQVRRLARQLLSGLKELDTFNIVHGDIKIENILVGDDYTIKISGFTYARVLKSPNETLSTTVGTPLTMAPEVIKGKSYDKKCDIWSLGVVLYQLLTGRYPFLPETFSQKELYKHILDPNSLKFPDYLSPTVKDLLSSMLTVDPKQRIELDKICEHPWIVRIGGDPSHSTWFPDTPEYRAEFIRDSAKLGEIKRMMSTDQRYTLNSSKGPSTLNLNGTKSEPPTYMLKSMNGMISPEPEYKITILGDDGAGKTVVQESFLNDGSVKEFSKSASGGSRTLLYPNGITAKVILSDIVEDSQEGEEEVKESSNTVMGHSIGVIIVYDVTNKETFQNCCKTWLNFARDFADADAAILLLGHLSDEYFANPSKREVSEIEAREFAENNEVLYMEASGSLYYNIQEAFEILIEEIRNNRFNEPSTGRNSEARTSRTESCIQDPSPRTQTQVVTSNRTHSKKFKKKSKADVDSSSCKIF